MDTHGEDICKLVEETMARLNLLKEGKSFKFHVEQCGRLCRYTLDKLSTYIHKYGLYLSGDSRSDRVERAWKEVYHALKEAETYLIHCSTDSCWINCFIHANTGEAFTLHMHDLAWSLLCLDLALLCPIEDLNYRIDLREFACRSSGFFAEMSRLHVQQFCFKFRDYWHLLMVCNQTAAKPWPLKQKNKTGVLQFMEKKLSESIKNVCEIESADGIPNWLQIPARDLTQKKKIGEGSFGTVYKGLWLGHRVAIKDIPVDARDLFDTETKVLSRLESPFIVQLIGTCIQGSHCSIVMELVRSSLDKLLVNYRGRAPLLLPVAVDLMLQISRGMEYLHRQGVMHMDLKASNVLIQPSEVPEFREQGYGRVKLRDFGMASLRLSSFRCQDPKGTCYWRAPEAFPFPNEEIDQEIDRLEEYTYKADVYSFAMTCYEILTGEQPFLGVNPKDLYRMIVQGRRPNLQRSSCPAVLADFIAKCWETDPSRRPCFVQVSTFMRNMKLFISIGYNPFGVPLESVRSKEEACDEIPAHKKLELKRKLVTWVRNFVPPEMKRRYNINLDLAPEFTTGDVSENSNARKGQPTILYSGSLSCLLHGDEEFLTWDRRKEIAVDVALGLAFLHKSGMVHGTVNSSTVLLDHKGKACLADSCSKGLVLENSHSGVLDREKYSSESWGFMAPKQFYRGKSSKESDVYSFGVLLLELLTGKDPLTASSHLPKLIFSINDEEWPMEMLDRELRSDIEIPNMWAMYRIAKQCTCLHEHSRPMMRQVVEMITNLSKMPNESRENGVFDEDWASLKNGIPEMVGKMPVKDPLKDLDYLDLDLEDDYLDLDIEGIQLELE